jgi:hypothetical protein
MGIHRLPGGTVIRMSQCGAVSISGSGARVGLRSRVRFNAARVNALEDRGAIDEWDPISIRRAPDLALGQDPGRFAELG